MPDIYVRSTPLRDYIYSFLPSMLSHLSSDIPCDRCRCILLSLLQSYNKANLLILNKL